MGSPETDSGASALASLLEAARPGSFFPTIHEPRRRTDSAMYALIMEAWVKGISTREVDALVAAIGSDAGISRSEVSRSA